MSAGPLHPSPLSLCPECKSQPQAAYASAPSYRSALYCLFHSAISPKLRPPLPSRLMKIRFYWLGSPTSAFIKDMRGAGGIYIYCRFIFRAEWRMGCLLKRWLFQLYTVDIKLERLCSVELFGKRSEHRFAHCVQAICSVKEIQFSAQVKSERGVWNVSSCVNYSL